MARNKKSKVTGPVDRRPTIVNRQARFQYHLDDRLEAGLVLRGSEVKSIRDGQIELRDGWVRVSDGEAWLIGCRIVPYSHATYDAPDPVRPRKLLLKKREIEKIEAAIRQGGMTVVPTKVYFKGSTVKIEIALGKGKKLHDKRETVKKRDEERRARASEDV